MFPHCASLILKDNLVNLVMKKEQNMNTIVSFVFKLIAFCHFDTNQQNLALWLITLTQKTQHT